MIRPRIKGALVELRLAESSDLENLVRWLSDPSVYQWWGGLPIAREEVARKYTGLRSPEVNGYIIEEFGTSVGYIQSWQGIESACGIDIFLDPARQGHGLGTDAVRALAEYLTVIEEKDVVTADPAPGNIHALAMFRTAGFVASGRITNEGNLEFVFKSQNEMR